RHPRGRLHVVRQGHRGVAPDAPRRPPRPAQRRRPRRGPVQRQPRAARSSGDPRVPRVDPMMRAIVLDAVPAPPEALRVRDLPLPEPRPGWVLIEVKAFGLNRSELKTRLGLADPEVTFPRVPGIEATGVVAACPGGELAVGETVVAMMGGMGRRFDGGYAEFTCVPVAQAIPFRSELPWTTVGAVPEMLQTAYGGLTAGLDVQPGQTLLIRGGTSSVGLTAAILAKRRGLTVLATTRSEAKAGALREAGADHVVVDDGTIALRVPQPIPRPLHPPPPPIRP